MSVWRNDGRSTIFFGEYSGCKGGLTMARAIDADAFMKEIRKWLGNETDFRSLQEIIAGMPTIEAEPVKHGKWTQTYASWSQNYDTSKNIRYRCSECNGIAVWDTKYCPHCGARMDGE